MRTYFVSDTHLGHKNILKYDLRPFNTIQEHDETIINNWNRIVTKNDQVFHLGDFCVRSERPAKWYLEKLNGSIHIIWGNHDDDYAYKFRNLFASHSDVKYIQINNTKIMMCHYPMATWRASHHGSWMLHGHCHSGTYNQGRRYDLSCNLHNYTPVSFEQINEYMQDKPIGKHHEDRDVDTGTPPIHKDNI